MDGGVPDGDRPGPGTPAEAAYSGTPTAVNAVSGVCGLV